MKDSENIPALMAEIGQRAKAAAAELAFASAERKHAALISAAEHVWTNRADILAANEKDMAFGRDKGLSPAMLDRLHAERRPHSRHRRRVARRGRTGRSGGRGDRRMGSPQRAAHPAGAHALGRDRRDL